MQCISTFVMLDKVFMSELSKFCGRQPLKNLKRYIKAVCLPQNVLRPLLNALSHVTVWMFNMLLLLKLVVQIRVISLFLSPRLILLHILLHIFLCYIPSFLVIFQSQQWKHQINVWNMFKANIFHTLF